MLTVGYMFAVEMQYGTMQSKPFQKVDTPSGTEHASQGGRHQEMVPWVRGSGAASLNCGRNAAVRAADEVTGQ